MDKKVTYSKVLPIVTGVIFIAVIILCFTMPMADYTQGTVYVTALTASAGCFTGVCVWYMKKAQSENAYKLQMSMYREQAKLELENLEKRLEIERKFNITKEQIDLQRMDSQLDDMTQDSFMDVQNCVDMAKSEADSSVEMSQCLG